MSTETIEQPKVESKPKTGQFLDKIRAEHAKNEPAKPAVVPPVAAPEKKEVATSEPKVDAAVKEAEVPAQKSILDSFSKLTQPAKEVEKPKEKAPEESFSDLRKRYEETEKKLKEVQSKIPNDYDSLKTNHQKLVEEHNLVLAELKKTNLAATPGFKEKYDSKLNASVNAIQKALATTDVESAQFIDLIKQPESKERTKKISEMVSEMDDFTKSKVSGSVAEFDRIRDEREQELSNPDPALKAFNEQREAQSRQQQEVAKRMIEDTISKAEKQYEWFREDTEDENWNSEVKGVRALAREIWTTPTSLEDQASVALGAAMAQLLGKLVHHYKEQNSILSADLAKYRGATPQNSAGKAAEITAPKGKGSFLNSFNKAIKGQ